MKRIFTIAIIAISIPFYGIGQFDLISSKIDSIPSLLYECSFKELHEKKSEKDAQKMQKLSKILNECRKTISDSLANKNIGTEQINAWKGLNERLSIIEIMFQSLSGIGTIKCNIMDTSAICYYSGNELLKTVDSLNCSIKIIEQQGFKKAVLISNRDRVRRYVSIETTCSKKNITLMFVISAKKSMLITLPIYLSDIDISINKPINNRKTKKKKPKGLFKARKPIWLFLIKKLLIFKIASIYSRCYESKKWLS